MGQMRETVLRPRVARPCAGRPENEASEPYLSDIGVPLKGFLLKNAYDFLQKKGLGVSILRVRTSCHLRS